MRVVIHFDFATNIRYKSDLRPWVVRLYPIKAKIFPSQINYEAMYRVKGDILVSQVRIAGEK